MATLVQCQMVLRRMLAAAEKEDPEQVYRLARTAADMVRTGIALRRERRLRQQDDAKPARKNGNPWEAGDAQADDDPRDLRRRIREDVYGIYEDEPPAPPAGSPPRPDAAPSPGPDAAASSPSFTPPSRIFTP